MCEACISAVDRDCGGDRHLKTVLLFPVLQIMRELIFLSNRQPINAYLPDWDNSWMWVDNMGATLLCIQGLTSMQHAWYHSQSWPRHKLTPSTDLSSMWLSGRYFPAMAQQLHCLRLNMLHRMYHNGHFANATRKCNCQSACIGTHTGSYSGGYIPDPREGLLFNKWMN